MSVTYRAAYWISADRQGEVRLTEEAQANLPDAELLEAARKMAEEVGLEGDGNIEIGAWTE